MYYATICAIAKDEEFFIKEWVEYHLLIGFEYIYIYDNNSHVPVAKILSEYIDNGLATVIDFPRDVDQQRIAYMDCLQKYGNQCKWMAFIDIDEFIVPNAADDIRDILDRYGDYGGLAIHWKMFGSGGHKIRPDGGVIKNYNQVVSCNNHIKSIVQPAKVNKVFTPHNFGYLDGSFCVNEDYIPVASYQSYHISKTVQINHYYYKSLEDFKDKLKRGCATGTDRDHDVAIADFERQETQGGELDQRIQNLVEQKKSSMATLEDIRQSAYGSRKTLAEFESLITDCISINKIALALNMVRICSRYYDAPIVWLLAARVYLLAGHHVECLHYLQKLLVDVDNPLRAGAYSCLADYYKYLHNTDAADSLQIVLS